VTLWPIYTGTRRPHDRIHLLPEAPNWRSFDGGPPLSPPQRSVPTSARRLGAPDAPNSSVRTPSDKEVQMVNAALFLRRPLLVTGKPGTGKSTLAYLIAEELGLGPVLRWPITSRSTLLEGLYRYDAIGRLREENLRQLRDRSAAARTGEPAPVDDEPSNSSSANPSFDADIGRHLRLGPLGTALLPYTAPRMLLIDEIDKSDMDLPNDLLNVFEEGEYVIDELQRLPEETGPVPVMTADPDGHADITHGHVRCRAFPFVLLTSNGEREFPPAFLRRCLYLDLDAPSRTQVKEIITAHLGPEATATAEHLVNSFLAKRDIAEVTTDQLLNAVYLATAGSRHEGRSPEEVASLNEVAQAVMRPLSGPE
jgi:MoxR-like ATPase